MRDKRKSRRRTMRYSAWLALEGEVLQGCAISDISETGARINVEDADALPDHMTLLLSGNGSPRRKCQVIWRQQGQIGVRFAPRLIGTANAGLVPVIDAGENQSGVIDLAAAPAPAKAD